MYDELVKRLRSQCQGYGKECEDCNADGNCRSQMENEAANAIEELSRENDSLAKSVNEASEILRRRWIPVTERLPKCNGCYLVWRPHFFGGEIGMPSICYFDGSNTWHDSYGVDFERILHPKDVTHWMPLPEPPEEDAE